VLLLGAIFGSAQS